MRIPLVPSIYQALMSGITQGTNIAHSQAQNAALAANEAIARQSLALKKQMLPYTMNMTKAQTNELNTRAQILGETFAWKKAVANHIFNQHNNSANSTSGAVPGAPQNVNYGGGGSIAASPNGNITAPNGNVYNKMGQLLSGTSSLPAKQTGLPFVPLRKVNFTPGMNINPGNVGTASIPLQAAATNSQSTNPSSNLITGPTEGYSPQQIAMGSIVGLKLPGYQASESPVQKANLAVQQSGAIQNKKLRDQYRTQIQALQETMGNLDSMRGIVEGKDGRSWWDGGIFGPASSDVGKFSDNANRATFKADTAKIVALLGKSFSSKGTNFGTKTAMSFKPSIDILPEQNAGMINVQGKNEQLEAQQLLSNYVRAGGSIKDFPGIDGDLDPNRYANITPNTTDPVGRVKLANGTHRYLTYSQFKNLPKGS